MKGIIKALKKTATEDRTSRGFGFITDEANQDRFFRAADVSGYPFDSLTEGQRVEFEPVNSPAGKGNGLRAGNVKVAQ